MESDDCTTWAFWCFAGTRFNYNQITVRSLHIGERKPRKYADEIVES